MKCYLFYWHNQWIQKIETELTNTLHCGDLLCVFPSQLKPIENETKCVPHHTQTFMINRMSNVNLCCCWGCCRYLLLSSVTLWMYCIASYHIVLYCVVLCLLSPSLFYLFSTLLTFLSPSFFLFFSFCLFSLCGYSTMWFWFALFCLFNL